MTHQKQRDGGDFEYAKEGDLANNNNEYAICGDGNDKPLADGNKAKDGNIVADKDKYDIGNDGVEGPLAKGNHEYDTLSAARMQACPESQRASVPSR
jgi:hypothetical protein